MSDETDENLVELQIRIAHQEAAIDSLTENVMALEKRLLVIDKQLQDIKSILHEAMPSLLAPQDQETPPPHY